MALSLSNLQMNHVFFDQPWFVQGQIFNLQRWRQDFDPFWRIYKILLFRYVVLGFCELWGELIPRKLLKQIGKVIKIDVDSVKVSKGSLLEYVAKLISLNPWKWKLHIKGVTSLNLSLLTMNITDICYECGQQDHKFKNCPMYPMSFSIKIEKRPVDYSATKSPY